MPENCPTDLSSGFAFSDPCTLYTLSESRSPAVSLLLFTCPSRNERLLKKWEILIKKRVSESRGVNINDMNNIIWKWYV